ncbi:MAG TPA: hypothetical protein VIJ06_03515 [Methylovirgula sp.]
MAELSRLSQRFGRFVAKSQVFSMLLREFAAAGIGWFLLGSGSFDLGAG